MCSSIQIWARWSTRLSFTAGATASKAGARPVGLAQDDVHLREGLEDIAPLAVLQALGELEDRHVVAAVEGEPPLDQDRLVPALVALLDLLRDRVEGLPAAQTAQVVVREPQGLLARAALHLRDQRLGDLEAHQDLGHDEGRPVLAPRALLPLPQHVGLVDLLVEAAPQREEPATVGVLAQLVDGRGVAQLEERVERELAELGLERLGAHPLVERAVELEGLLHLGVRRGEPLLVEQEGEADLPQVPTHLGLGEPRLERDAEGRVRDRLAVHRGDRARGQAHPRR